MVRLHKFSPLCTVGETGHEVYVDDTMHYIDYKLSDLECGLDTLEPNLGNSLNVTNYDKFDNISFKKGMDQILVHHARSCCLQRANRQCVWGYSDIAPDALAR